MSWNLNDPPPKFGAELAECQRYQKMLKSADTYAYSQFGFGFAISETTANILIPLSPQMRARPTLKSSGKFALWDGSFHPVTNLILSDSSTRDTLVVVATSSGLTKNSAYSLAAYKDASAYLLPDANL